MRDLTYIRELFSKEDEVLQSIPNGLAERGMPQISIPPEVGRTLYLLAKISGATRILELGTLGGYSTICLARALPSTGKCFTIELNAEHARFAKENISRANLDEQVTVIVGDASEQLEKLAQSGERFDFFFIDADKPNFDHYLEKAISLAAPNAVIAMDNLLYFGDSVVDETNDHPILAKLREVNQTLAQDPRLESMLLPIGDGLGIAKVKSV
ncbi:O-methyltransferase [Laceyella sacchari]|uniref:O-methyltransferase n=1 Tax=Laceyella sacchari TaxID=37482 RepID=A0ABY5U8X5_LACSH|nr:O-methyltransferase [Laceyella sacchari]UWE05090.1 O-methyltransferase [Laceyella sacchari]